ncbi:hypothetical protein [Deinococcus sp. LM3]|uniref:hypothetical protein n=1 Tax=Deinococcus sp. LM3 TaxID=1938608 RepID=UPI00117DDC06|nr:hypothetical protein [Deinococcus sp. LM3]
MPRTPSLPQSIITAQLNRVTSLSGLVPYSTLRKSAISKEMARDSFEQEFPRPLESRATQRCDGTEEEKRRSARHFPCCVLEEIFGRDEPFSA